MIMRKILLIFAGAVLCSTAAAQTAGSNIALNEYPGPTCTKPQKKPFLPIPAERSTDSQPFAGSRVGRQITIPARAAGLYTGGKPDGDLMVEQGNGDKRSYNDKVDQYNKDLRAYNANITQFNSCMKTYVDNGNADLMRVKQKLDAVVAAANAQQ